MTSNGPPCTLGGCAGKLLESGSPEVDSMGKKIGLALCAILLLAGTARAQNPSKEERAIRALAAHWQNDWNHHNFKALANLLTVDGDYVTDQGVWLQGRAAFKNWFAKEHLRMYQASRWTHDQLTIRFLQPDIAVIHIRWAIQGDLDQSSRPRKARPGISTWLVVKLGDGWKIRVAQATSGAP